MASDTAPARAQSLSTLLDNLKSCLTSASSSLPATRKGAPSDVSIEPPQDGISLLDTKSEILLSYLHNLVFLIILQLRNTSSKQVSKDPEDVADAPIREEAVKKLVELRVFLDRGVRPLEGRLKYQVDKVVKAAEDAERTERPGRSRKSKKASKADQGGGQASSDEDASGSDEDSDEEDEDMDEMAYRPNVAAFSKSKPEEKKSQATSATQAPSDGIYRPPKIMPTSLPSTERREREDRRPRRSNVIDEFVNAEMSSAPMAEPSIGSTIIAGGRQTKSKKDREHEADRTRYEETNFVRLPKETKKEKAKRGGRRDATFGGDEWKGLTEGADRIERLTRRGKSGGAALEKSRKRKNDDGQRSDGVGMGEIFDKRRKKIDSWKR
jgi:U3 small nucleolar ribonucleoprotein protein LCP5